MEPEPYTTREQDHGMTRWSCRACPWATAWTYYTDYRAGPAALRHELSHREATP